MLANGAGERGVAADPGLDPGAATVTQLQRTVRGPDLEVDERALRVAHRVEEEVGIDERVERGLELGPIGLGSRSGVDELLDLPQHNDPPDPGVVGRERERPARHPVVTAVAPEHPERVESRRAVGVEPPGRRDGPLVVGVHELVRGAPDEPLGSPAEDRLGRTRGPLAHAQFVAHENHIGRVVEELLELPVGDTLETHGRPPLMGTSRRTRVTVLNSGRRAEGDRTWGVVAVGLRAS